MSTKPTRREFLGALGVGALGTGAWGRDALVHEGAAVTTPVASSPRRAVGFELGVASYSLRNFSRTYAIQAIQSLGIPYDTLKLK